MEYLDFELEIGVGSGREYPIAVLRSAGGEARETMRFPFDELALESRLKDVQIALRRSGGTRRSLTFPDESTVREFGSALFEALFTGDIRAQYAVTQNEARAKDQGVQLKLRIQAPELAALPWEFLYDTRLGRYLCLSSHTPLVRYPEVAQAPQVLSVRASLSILAMTASPRDWVELDLQRERQRLEQALRPAQDKGQVKLTWLEGHSWLDLQKAMRRGPWHIFYFLGHGGFREATQEGLIVLEDEAGKAYRLSATQLSQLLIDHHSLRLVVLNSCEGAKGNDRDVFSSTAATLVRNGIPAVLAMQHEITDKAAMALSRAFYDALADGLPVDTAVSEARKAINLEVENTLEWGTPVLYMRSPDGVLFDLTQKSSGPQEQPARPPTGETPSEQPSLVPSLPKPPPFPPSPSAETSPTTSTPPQPVPAASGTAATASTRAPMVPTDRNRERMLKRVHATWIAGVLEQSLHGAALLELGLEEKTDVLDNPWRLLMQEVDRPTRPLPGGMRITQVYDTTEGGLLILGEPGAGKTTLLLELARDLLDRAQSSENAPIPVIFNLSSWAKKRPALTDWLVEELSLRYEVPRWIGQSWVGEDRLLLLLDGLDEVASAVRKECIEAINSYRQTHPDVQIVVCSRRTEYLNEPTQLRLHTAVVVQPLTQEQIETYLESGGEQAEALCEALRQDADLRELATTPLMLTILSFAYKGTSPGKTSELPSFEAKREQIFASYVQHMLKRRGASKRYAPEQITHWLTYLAGQMKRQNQTIFYMEQMQPDWLLNGWPGSFYRALAGGGVGGLLCGLIGAAAGAIFSSISAFSSIPFQDTPIPWPAIAVGLVIGLIIGQILGSLIGLFRLKSTEISTVEVLTWSWANVRQTALAAFVGGPLGALILFHFVSFISVFLRYLVLHVPVYSFPYWLITVVSLLIYLIIVAVVGSSTYSEGEIGVIVTGDLHQTEVIFQNAKVWKLGV